MKKIKRNILLNPGPATTTDSVKYAQVVPDICPREKEFGQLLRSLCADLTRIVKGGYEYTTVLFAGSGTAAMDAVINSVVPPGKKIGVVVNGAYGERMVKIAEAYGIACVPINHEWGEKIELATVQRTLQADPGIACVAVVHHETTTGILNPIAEIGQIVKTGDRTYIIDAISSYAGIPISVKECQVDYLMSTSNKCIQGMAGLSFIISRKTELLKTKDYPRRSFYLNLYNQYEHLERTGQLPFTPPVQVAYALKQAIKEYFKEGGVNRYKRYTSSWRTLRQGLLDLGFRLFHKEEDESHLLLTVYEPDHPKYNFDSLHDFLYERGFTIYPGKVGREKSFRLANIGAIDERDITNFLKLLSRMLNNMGVTLK